MSNFTYWKLHISIHALRKESDLRQYVGQS